MKIGIIGFIGIDARVSKTFSCNSLSDAVTLFFWFILNGPQNLIDIGEVQITDARTAIEQEAKKLRDKSVHLIIGLGNVGFEEAKFLLENLDDVDIIVNGGSGSTFLWTSQGIDINNL